MAEPVVDAVAVTSRDLAASVAFYRRLGLEIPAPGAGDKHVEARAASGGARLMIDDAELIEDILGEAPKPGNHASFALRLARPAEVDRTVAALKGAGDRIVREPWDAVWGQRYAVVEDPDGYRIDLFAPL
jgi:catechol 2,3-dioxygenase-like lactoylglutathione lyase family enzyme